MLWEMLNAARDLGRVQEIAVVLIGYGFGSFVQGYVFLAPLDRLHSVTWIDGFINDSNFKKAHAVAKKMRWISEGECETPKELDAKLAERFCGP